MYIDFTKYIDWFLDNNRDVLQDLIHGEVEEFREDILEYLLYEKMVCPKCFGNLRVIYEKGLITTDPVNIYEDESIGLVCSNETCNFKHLFN